MMGGGKNAYLQREEDKRKAWVKMAERVTEQFMTDTLQITLHEEFGWGYDRIMDLTKKWEGRMLEYRPALNSKDAEADVCQEHMDRIMVQILRGKPLMPFGDRYPELRKVRY